MSSGSWNEFTNNLATDLTPLLALFGEQITKQFLSESLDWIDHVILAMAPLGILTIMVSAVRVRGSSAARAFIGRAQESRGNVEAELMSSTSHDVCELWNGDGVARVLGKPRILEFVVDASAENDGAAFYDHVGGPPSTSVIEKPSCNLYSFKEYIRLWDVGESMHSAPWYCEKRPAMMEYQFLQYDHAKDVAPNLSLNIGIVRPSRLVRALIALVGVLIQLSVLVYAAIAYYMLSLPNEFDEKPWYAFLTVILGTVMINSGIFMCAMVIGGSTAQEIWSRRSWSRSEIFWLQSGGQTVGDQLFGPFACRAKPVTYLTSRNINHTSQSSEVMVYLACGWSLIGFILQFVGLRGMHPSVALAQLAATIVMAVLRAAMRMRRSRNNLLKDNMDRVQGSELDWLSLELHSCTAWSVCTIESRPPFLLVDDIILGREVSDKPMLTGISRTKTFKLAEHLHLEASIAALLQNPYLVLPLDKLPRPNLPTSIFKSRARLGRMAHSWTIGVLHYVQVLQCVIESTADIVFSGDIHLLEGWESVSTILWPLKIATAFQEIASRNSMDTFEDKIVTISMRRTFDSESAAWTGWKIEQSEIESVLSLWLWSLKETATERAAGSSSVMRMFSEVSEEAKTDYKMWVFRQTSLATTTIHLPPAGIGVQLDSHGVRIFGQSGAYSLVDQLTRTQATITYTSCEIPLAKICSQELFAAFFATIMSTVLSIGGATTRRSIRYGNDDRRTNNVASGNETFRLKNSVLNSLALNFNDRRLGTVEEAFMCMIPILRTRGLLPSAADAHNDARESSRIEARQRRWPEASELLWWIYHSTSNLIDRPVGGSDCWQAASDIGELYRSAIQISDDLTSQDFGYAGICKMLADIRPTSPEYQIAEEYAWIGVRHAIDTQNTVQTAALQNAGAKDGLIPAYHDNMTLVEASSLGSLPAIKLKLITCLTDIAGKNSQGESALTCAARMKHIDAVRLLLDHGAKDTKNDLGRTGISYAAAHGDDELLSLLLVENSSWVDARDEKGRTPLYWAAANGQLLACERLLTFSAVNIDMRDKLSQTPLYKAAENNHFQVVELLVAKGADCDAQSDSKMTPLHAAIEKGSIDLISFLCAHGANVRVSNSFDETPLYRACWFNRIDVARFLIAKSASVDDVTQSGETALHAATQNGSLDIIEILVNAGADTRAFDEFCRSSLHFAVLNERPQVLHFLISKGADVNAVTNNGETALHQAARHESTDCLEILLRHDPDITITNRDGESALFLAAANGRAKAVELLAAAVSDLDASDERSNFETPLHIAAKNGHVRAVEILLNAGAKLDSMTICGKTALTLAQTCHQDDVANILLASGAEVQQLQTYQSQVDAPSLGIFCTYEQHGWGNPAIAHSDPVLFSSNYMQRPHISVGLNMVDTQKWYGPRVEAFANDVSNVGFTLHLNTWADSILLAAAASWVCLPSDDGDFQSGELKTSELNPWYRPQKAISKRITFARPYKEIPHVFVQLKGFDPSQHHTLRVKAYAAEITKTGFNLCLDTWGDSILWYGSVSWVAYANSKPGICSGTAEIPTRSDRTPQVGESGTVYFPEGKFKSTPAVHLALAWLEVEKDEHLRIKCYAANVTACSFDWHIESWLDSKFLGAGVAFMAIENAGETPIIANSYQ